MSKKLSNWFSDRVFNRVVKNSFYLIFSNLISIFLTVFVTRKLGVYNYGVLGIITAYVTNVNRFFSFRMNEMIVRYVSEPFEREEHQKVGALIKFGALIEGGTSLLAFLFLVLTVNIGTRLFLKDESLIQPVLFYGLTILTSFAMETANGVMRVINRYRTIALISLIQNVLVVILVVVASKQNTGLNGILFAYFTGKVILGLVPVLLDILWLPKMIGEKWWQAPLSLIENKRDILHFTVSTNISSTINLFARDGEILWVGALLTPLYAGYYKNAMTVINLVLTPIVPFIDTTYPEMMRAIVNDKWRRLRRLLRKVTAFSGIWTIGVGLVLLFFGKELLYSEISLFGFSFQVFSAEFMPAIQLILILLIGYGIANIFFWNRTLLLSLSRAGTATRVNFYGMVLKIICTLLFVPRFPYVTEAVIMTTYMAGTVIIMTVIGLRSLNRAERAFLEREDIQNLEGTHA